MGLSAHVLHTRPAKSDGMDMLCTQLLTAPSQKATGSKAAETYECLENAVWFPQILTGKTRNGKTDVPRCNHFYRFVASLWINICEPRNADIGRPPGIVWIPVLHSFAIVLEITNWTTLMVSIICHSFVAGWGCLARKLMPAFSSDPCAAFCNA